MIEHHASRILTVTVQPSGLVTEMSLQLPEKKNKTKQFSWVYFTGSVNVITEKGFKIKLQNFL